VRQWKLKISTSKLIYYKEMAANPNTKSSL
jgi:hypothetical protein